MYVRKCGACDQLFEVDAGHPTDTLNQTKGLVRTVPIDLCPTCRQAAQQRGQPPTPEEQETPAAEPQEETPPEGARGAR